MADAVAGQCGCAGVAAGKCEACLTVIGAMLRRLVDQTTENRRRVGEILGNTGVCQACAARDFDLGLARTLGDLVAMKGPDLPERLTSVITVAYMMAQATGQPGLSGYPLTEKLLRDLGAA